MRKYYDPKRLKGPALQEGDRVYLFRGKKGKRNIKSKRPCDKLDFEKKGPYLIEKKVHQDVYRIRLPPKSKMHPIVHASLLEPANKDIPLATDEVEQEGTDEYEVERILDSEKQGQQVKYLIKWEGYPRSESTWEPIAHLRKVLWMVDQFHLDHPDRPDGRKTAERQPRKKPYPGEIRALQDKRRQQKYGRTTRDHEWKDEELQIRQEALQAGRSRQEMQKDIAEARKEYLAKPLELT
jgi:hypothetical protein